MEGKFVKIKRKSLPWDKSDSKNNRDSPAGGYWKTANQQEPASISCSIFGEQ